MARIRTIKPEFWTDEKIVALPFQARLLFIGLWNFCDDSGCLDYSPDRIGLQIFPGNPEVDISGMLDLLSVIGLIDFMVDGEGGKAISVTNWVEHQKIDNPSKKSIVGEGYRKLAIPSEARIVVARRHGCIPGGESTAQCFYCGSPGKVFWHIGSRGRPTKWIYLSDLEFDHFVSEFNGGENNEKNLVLACRLCNRKKHDKNGLEFFSKQNKLANLDSPIESSPLDQGSRKGSRIKDQSMSATPTVVEVFEHWKKIFKHPKSTLDEKRKKVIIAALKNYPVEVLTESLSGYLNSPHHMGKNQNNTVYDEITLLLRDSAHVDAGVAFFKTPPKPPEPKQPMSREGSLLLTPAEIEKRKLEKLVERRAKMGDAHGFSMADFRLPNPDETSDQYRDAQNAEWSRRYEQKNPSTTKLFEAAK